MAGHIELPDPTKATIDDLSRAISAIGDNSRYGGLLACALAGIYVERARHEDVLTKAYEDLVGQLRVFLERPDVLEHVPIMMLADLDQIVTESQIDLQHVLNPEEQDEPAQDSAYPPPSAPEIPGDS